MDRPSGTPITAHHRPRAGGPPRSWLALRRSVSVRPTVPLRVRIPSAGRGCLLGGSDELPLISRSRPRAWTLDKRGSVQSVRRRLMIGQWSERLRSLGSCRNSPSSGDRLSGDLWIEQPALLHPNIEICRQKFPRKIWEISGKCGGAPYMRRPGVPPGQRTAFREGHRRGAIERAASRRSRNAATDIQTSGH